MLSIMQSMRQKLEKVSQKPLPRLVGLFVDRIFRGGESSEDELDMSMGLVLSLLALPGGFYSVFLLEKYSTLLQWLRHQHEVDPLAAALPDEYFFIVLSMAVTGAVAVWRWDSISPIVATTPTSFIFRSQPGPSFWRILQLLCALPWYSPLTSTLPPQFCFH